MGAELPLPLLEDISRPLVYLDNRSGHGGPHSHKAGCSRRPGRDAAPWESGLKIKRLQSQAV